jgi:hypothetical protein
MRMLNAQSRKKIDRGNVSGCMNAQRAEYTADEIVAAMMSERRSRDPE